LVAVNTAAEDIPRGVLVVVVASPTSATLDHIMSSCNAPNDALLRWTLAKRKMIIQKYSIPGGSATAHATLQSVVTAADDTDGLPTLEDSIDEFDDTKVSVPFISVAFSSSLSPGRDLSLF
jgi:hypothetical protein